MGFFSVWLADSVGLSPAALAPLLTLELIVLFAGGMYFADVISGIVHVRAARGKISAPPPACASPLLSHLTASPFISRAAHARL